MLALNSWLRNFKKVHLTCVFYSRSGFKQSRKKGIKSRKGSMRTFKNRRARRNEQ